MPHMQRRIRNRLSFADTEANSHAERHVARGLCRDGVPYEKSLHVAAVLHFEIGGLTTAAGTLNWVPSSYWAQTFASDPG